MIEPLRKPHLDDRLSRHAQAHGFPVQGLNHPGRKIHVDPLLRPTRPFCSGQIKVADDIAAAIEFAVKLFCFYTVLPPSLASDAQK